MKNSIKTAIALCCLIMSYIIPVDTYADTNKAGFINITYLNGLTTNTIYDLETDPSGCIWIGTGTGLSKYDGYYVKNYFKEEMNIRSNTIKYLHRDRQNRLWIGTSNGVGLYDIDSDKFLTLDMLSGDIIEKKTAGIFEDSQGTIWIPFRKGGLISIDPNTFSTKNYFDNITGNDYFARIWFEPENNLYLAAKFNQGLFYLEPEKGNIIPFSTEDPNKTYPFENKCIRGLIKVSQNSFCITCTDATMWLVNPYDKTYEELPLEGISRSVEFRRVFIIGKDKLGVTHNKGFFVYDLQTRSVESNEFADNFIDKNIYCIRGTLENGLIVGTFNDGITIQQERPFHFSLVRDDQTNKKITLKESNVTGFAQIDESQVFVSTRIKGLFRYDLDKKRLKKWSSPFIPKTLEGVTAHEGHIWTWSSSGIYSLNPQTGTVKSYLEGCCEVSSLIATKDGRLILLSDERLLQYDPAGDCFNEIKEFKEMSVLSVGRSESSSLVAITKEKGLIRWQGKRIYDIEDKHIKYDKSHRWTGLLFEDKSSHIWSALPESGVFISSDENFSSITTRSGLSSDIITNIVKDNSDNVFITTDRSLSMISPEGKMFSLTKSDGLLNFGFSRNAAFRTSTGEILLGSRDGFTIIKKNSRTDSQYNGARIKAVEKIICNGEEIPINDKGQAKLKHHQNSFHISVIDIDPHTVATGKSLFCMVGHDHTWVPAGNDRKLSYLNLKPGKYFFKAYNNLIEPVEIKVCAHPLLSVTANIIYILATLILMFFIIKYIRDHEIRKRKEKMMQMKLDLHQEKLDFFTNIAHEIKTPLTLITTPLNHLKSNGTIDEEGMYDINVMDKHASYLSTLVRELLEFSKIERGTYNVSCSPVNLTSLASNIITNFKEQNQGLKWDIAMPEKALWVMADTSATMKVLNNLVYNAIKYTDSYIEIELAEGEGGCVTISVANDGNIIPADMRERIFRTFVQYNPGQNESKEGFGIGLSVAKTLAELQHGSLHMTEDHDVNKFVFSLPVTESPAETTVEDKTAHETVSDISVNERRSTVLVVEDHPELLEYIRKTLSRHYNILTAPNGAKAFETIKSQSNIDLVLTDLKMPEMSGMELCKKIKQDHTFSHILLIILSANLTPETKIESLKNGADAIIEKPFSMDFLELRIESLINSRKQLIEKISKNHEFEEENQDDSNDGLSARDIVFLRELNVCVEENFNDPDFGVEELAAQLNISRSSLNRKMRDILDTTANNYIRDKKIEKAEELLRTSSMQINEICYKVGFTTPSYFIKCFRKKYGMSPNEYANSNH